MSLDSNEDHAGALIPGPVPFAIATLIGLSLQYLFPLAVFPQRVSIWIGAVSIAASVVAVVSAVRALNRADTVFDARKATTRVVSDGAFRYSRNPTYLSLALLQVGLALLLNSIWVLLMIVPAVVVTHQGIILREERYLESKFGDEYRRYTEQVRRWL
jgi:protein-S-isoprenylcysteine O-methyltransferase Ste14